jgi:hypothetical protein
MIRFHCPLCSQPLKVPEDTAGATVVCPLCREATVVPGGRQASARRQQGAGPVPQQEGSLKWRPLVALAAGVAVVCIVVAVVAPDVAWVVIPCLVVGLLVVLHGCATRCPSCGKWWARCEIETEFVERQVLHRDDGPHARATYRTNYECRSCRQRWSLTRTEEYKDFIKDRRQPRQRLG